MNPQRSELISLLEREMARNTSWVRIHAAEGLLDAGQAQKVLELFRPEADTSPAPYRIGVWRVLARATNGLERDEYVARIRKAFEDPQALDRISAAESLGKLQVVSHADRAVVLRWLNTADDATAAFPRWLLVLSSANSERADDETGLAKLLSSRDVVARLRSAFALGRLKIISGDSLARLRKQLQVEPADSIAHVYLVTALLLHVKDDAELSKLEQHLAVYTNGKPHEQLELGIVTGLRGKSAGIARLTPLLASPEADARIGAAIGILHLIQ